MKVLLIALCSLFFLQVNGVSQPSQMPIFIGKPSSKIKSYLDSIKGIKSPNNMVIENSSSSNGDYMLSAEGDYMENILGFHQTFFVFDRINGLEICKSQTLFGDGKYAYINLSKIKDLFIKTGDNEWEIKLANGERIKATYVLSRNDKGQYYYTIDYRKK
jgi:hypothetical protein